MNMRRYASMLLLLAGAALAFASFPLRATGESLTDEQLIGFLPEASELTGFVPVRPAGELVRVPWRADPARELHRVVRRRKPVPFSILEGEFADTFGRTLYSIDGTFRLDMSVILCDTTAALDDAVRQVHKQSAGRWEPGTYGSPSQLGDASWTNDGMQGRHTVMFRYGRAWVEVTGDLSNVASHSGVKAEFPPEAVQAVAEAIWLRLARSAELVGAGDRLASVTVNGRRLSARAPVLSGRAIVPVKQVAQAAGWRVGWDAKTGRVTLSKGSGTPVALLAGSSSARRGAGKAGKTVALGSTVLTEKGQPVMALDDLVALMGGTVHKAEGRVSVRI